MSYSFQWISAFSVHLLCFFFTAQLWNNEQRRVTADSSSAYMHATRSRQRNYFSGDIDLSVVTCTDNWSQTSTCTCTDGDPCRSVIQRTSSIAQSGLNRFAAKKKQCCYKSTERLLQVPGTEAHQPCACFLNGKGKCFQTARAFITWWGEKGSFTWCPKLTTATVI